MGREIANEKDFADKLKQLGDLYEEAKGCANTIYFESIEPKGHIAYDRIHEILQQMRDIAATQMQSIHWVETN